MSDLIVVDENDNAIGRASFEKAHKENLLHRNVQVLIFRESKMKNLLVVRACGSRTIIRGGGLFRTT